MTAMSRDFFLKKMGCGNVRTHEGRRRRRLDCLEDDMDKYRSHTGRGRGAGRQWHQHCWEAEWQEPPTSSVIYFISLK
jgi:hypothetical protein